MIKRRPVFLLWVVLLVGMVLGGGLTGPREACADCIDGCIWGAEQCRSSCAPEDWSCLGACDAQQDRCISYCSP